MMYVLNEKEIVQALLDYIAKTAMPHTGSEIDVKAQVHITRNKTGIVAEISYATIGGQP